MADLAQMRAEGHRAVLLYLVQRSDATRVTVAADIDPAYATALRDAQAQGVEVIAMGAEISPQGITVGAPLPFALPDA